MRYLVPLLVVLLVGPAFAQGGHTLYGGSGGAVLPTAEVLGEGLFDVSIDWHATDGDDTMPLRLLYGVSGNLEAGAMFAFNDASDVWGFNAKLGTRWFNSRGGGTAVGLQFVEVDDFDADGWQIYAVHTRPISTMGGAQWRGNLGVNWTHVDVLSFDDDAFRLFAGVDATWPNGLTVGLELQSGSGDLGDDGPLSSLYARYRYSDRWTFQAGFTNAAPGGLVSGDDHNLFLGATYAFGGPGARRNLGAVPAPAP